MIPASDLEILQSFDGRGSVALSAYLRLDTPQRRAQALEEFQRQMQRYLDDCGLDVECREALQEDIEIVKLYLGTNGQRQHGGLAIFSCAAELFWRAYPLPVPLPSKVSVGPKFDVGPLLQTLGQPQPL